MGNYFKCEKFSTVVTNSNTIEFVFNDLALARRGSNEW